MGWFKESQNENFIEKVKDILKKHSFTNAISNYYHIPISEVDTHLEIEVCDLHGKFAEGNGKLIRIDKKLLDNDFFDENFHFVIHEFFHWLKRRSENKFYFNDPEEVQSFVLQMAWNLINGKSEEEVTRKIYPIIKAHFKDQNKFEDVFTEMLNKAINLYQIYQRGGEFSI
jgi:hypothetical protein